MKLNALVPLLLLFFCSITTVFSQVTKSDVDAILKDKAAKYGLSTSDLSDYLIKNQHESSTSKVKHVYLRQRHQGIEIFTADASVHLLPNGELLQHNNKFVSDVANKAGSPVPTISRTAAIQAVANAKGYTISGSFNLIKNFGNVDQKAVYSKGGISLEDIPIQLMYYPNDAGQLELTWDLSILELSQENWWSIKVNATTGAISHETNWMVKCNLSPNHHRHSATCSTPSALAPKRTSTAKSRTSAMSGDQYNVFPIGVESPNHGVRMLVTDPADPIASPFGWHDTNGAAGAEFTITRGNNVIAQEDQNGNNGSGLSPDGTASLHFDFPLDLNLLPGANLDAMTTNLFYWNNIVHDVTYLYGFDEASGNFQVNNYGNGGLGTDEVFADAQDGSGINNANFGTPPDGSNPRMQMFLWVNESHFTVNAPAGVAGEYGAAPASFGTAEYNITGNVVVVDDGTAAPTEGCNTLVNSAAVNGNIALVDRGGCDFATKGIRAQNAGAIAVIICNNVPDPIFGPGGGQFGGLVNIPVMMISQADCATLRTEIPSLNVTMEAIADTDGSVENGIITHEYGHGISNRLVGGPGNVSCLGNQEQMGEGWSDIYGLLLTMEPGDAGTDTRGIGTYAIGQPITGGGIRPFPYSTDLAINPTTYGSIATGNFSVPHGVGSVWCEMLWEMTWGLIDKHGFDNDFYNGTGGNNVALALITEGLKFTDCSPGFVDGRDGILAADVALYGGANKCIIWEAFAKRGLGASATQGSSGSITDGTEAFDLPFPATDSDGDGVLDECDICSNGPDDYDFNNNGTPDLCEGCGGVPVNLNLTTNPLVSDLYRAQSTVTTVGTVEANPGSSSLISAGSEVILGLGFHAKAESEVHIYIAPCGPTSLQDETSLYEAPQTNLTTPLTNGKLDMLIMPNPMRGTSQIQYEVPNSGNVTIGLYNARGQKVRNIVSSEWKEAGTLYTLSLDGSQFESGYYYLSLNSEKEFLTKKIAIIRN